MPKRKIPIPIKPHRSDFPVQVERMKGGLGKCVSANTNKGDKFREAVSKCVKPDPTQPFPFMEEYKIYANIVHVTCNHTEENPDIKECLIHTKDAKKSYDSGFVTDVNLFDVHYAVSPDSYWIIEADEGDTFKCALGGKTLSCAGKKSFISR